MLMDREVQYYMNEICDICGEKGAYDFMGDYICKNCVQEDYYLIDDSGKRIE